MKSINFISTLVVSLYLFCSGNVDGVADKLHDLANRRPVVKFNAEKFRKFIVTKPRDYDVIVMMTALNPQRSCSICRSANEEYTITAQSFRYSPHFETKKLFFASVDYDEGSDVFKQLNINSAPGFLFFAAEGNHLKPDELNIQRLGFDAEVLARWVNEKTGFSFKIVRPPNFSGPILVSLLGLITLSIMYASRNSLSTVFNTNFWALGSVIIVLFMTSGQMWNQIRGAPFKQISGGQSIFIHQSSSAQFGFESYYIMALNAAIALCILLMTESMRQKKRIYAIAGLGTIVFSFSLLLATVRYKSYGYPYRLLL